MLFALPSLVCSIADGAALTHAVEVIPELVQSAANGERQKSPIWEIQKVCCLQGDPWRVLFFLLLVASDGVSTLYGLSGSERIVDDLLGGLLAGIILFCYERHRLQVLTERLLIIDLLNHHIRNALQPLLFMGHERNRERQMEVISDCVTRIDFALREILPGKNTERFIDTKMSLDKTHSEYSSNQKIGTGQTR